MTTLSTIALARILNNFPVLGNTKLFPVIADGNCAFRVIIQDLMMKYIFDNSCTEEQLCLINNFFFELIEKHNATITAIRDEKNQSEGNVTQEELKSMLFSLDDAKDDDQHALVFMKNYFPTELNFDGRTYKYPDLDKFVKTLAFCLRLEIITPLLNNPDTAPFVDANELNEHGYSSIASILVLNLFRAKKINITIFDADTGNKITESENTDAGMINVNIAYQSSKQHYVGSISNQIIARFQDINITEAPALFLEKEEEEEQVQVSNDKSREPQLAEQLAAIKAQIAADHALALSLVKDDDSTALPVLPREVPRRLKSELENRQSLTAQAQIEADHALALRLQEEDHPRALPVQERQPVEERAREEVARRRLKWEEGNSRLLAVNPEVAKRLKAINERLKNQPLNNEPPSNSFLPSFASLPKVLLASLVVGAGVYYAIRKYRLK